MSDYALSLLAKADIFDIWRYVAEDSQANADFVEQAIYDACALLAKTLMRGHSRSELTSRPLRFQTLTRYRNYTVAYRPDTSPLQVVAVLHGKRNVRRVLKERP